MGLTIPFHFFRENYKGYYEIIYFTNRKELIMNIKTNAKKVVETAGTWILLSVAIVIVAGTVIFVKGKKNPENEEVKTNVEFEEDAD